jgi:hypothetical protein
MSVLSDTQLFILSTACKRESRLILPLPDRIRGAAVHKVINSLITKKLAAECDAKPGEPVWRKTSDGSGITLIVTDLAYAALGIKPDPASGTKSPTPAKAHTAKAAPRTPKAGAANKMAARTPRKDSKQARMIALLRRAKGATIDEMVEALDWQPHTVRGAMAGALKKKLGLNIVSERCEKRGRVYCIAD